MMRLVFSVVLAFALGSVFGPVSGQQLYRWVDANGKVHYSDQPPPPNVKQKKIEVLKSPSVPVPAEPAAAEPGAAGTGATAGAASGKPAGAEAGKAPAAAAGPKSLAEKELDLKKRRMEAEEAEAKAAAEAKNRQDKCVQAQKNLKLHQDTPRLFNYDEKGERVYVDDATRQREIEKAQQDIASFCQ